MERSHVVGSGNNSRLYPANGEHLELKVYEDPLSQLMPRHTHNTVGIWRESLVWCKLFNTPLRRILYIASSYTITITSLRQGKYTEWAMHSRLENLEKLRETEVSQFERKDSQGDLQCLYSGSIRRAIFSLLKPHQPVGNLNL